MPGEQVVRLRKAATGTDPYGNPISTETETAIDGCFFDPGGSREPVEVGRDQTVTTPKAYFPGQWPDITDDDRLRVRGLVFDVEGIPPNWRSPYGSGLGGLVVELKRSEG